MMTFKKILAFVVAILLLQTVYAQEQNAQDKKVVSAGITPDSFLWGLDKAFDNLNLLFTFSPSEKARKGLEIAKERLAEIKAMVEDNKIDAAKKAEEDNIKIIAKVKSSISDIKEANSTKQLEEEIKIEKELEEHESELRDSSNELKSKIEVKGALNEQQKELVNKILNSLENSIGDAKLEIKNKKDKTKIKIKNETGKSEKEIEDETEKFEEEQGLADIKREKAWQEIENAKEDLRNLEKELQEHKSEGHITNETSIATLIENAEKRLSNAEDAFQTNKFGEAFGQANAAIQLIKNAERILEKVVEKFEKEGKHNGDESSKGKNPICKVGGCSGELCGEESDIGQIATICIFKPEYECFKKYGICEVQANGQCAWTQTKELVSCIKEKKEKETDNDAIQ